jgi:hypothetical protein
MRADTNEDVSPDLLASGARDIPVCMSGDEDGLAGQLPGDGFVVDGG